MNKEQWIEEVMQSLRGQQTVDAPASVSMRTWNRITQRDELTYNYIKPAWVWATGACMTLLLLINLLLVSGYSAGGKNDDVQQVMRAYGLSDNNFYAKEISN